MSLVKISSKGQITIPAKIRMLLEVETNDKLELMVRDDKLSVQPLKSFKKLRGSLTLRRGNARKVMEAAVAEHVLGG